MQVEKGLIEKNAFVSEVSFGNVAKVMSAIHVFENCEKCNSLFMSVFFCLLTFQAKMNFLWIKLCLKFLLKWWVFICVWGWIKVQLFVYFFYCVCHCCFKAVWKMKRRIISSVKKSSASLFLQNKWGASLCLQKKWSASLFLQKKRCLIIFSKKKHFLLKKSWGASFMVEEIMRRLIFQKK